MLSQSQFPLTRLRRNRKSKFIRDLIQEHHISSHDLIYPVFILDGVNREEPILAMPGQNRLSIDRLLYIAEQCLMLDVPGIALFPMIETAKNDPLVRESYNPDGLIPRAIRALKQRFPELGIFTDIALDGYTHDGHDGVTNQFGVVDNDFTTQLLIKQALTHAEAGADFVCPSDMMDGRIGLIRGALEANNFKDVGIMAYSAKYASAFYGPFREATGAASDLGQDGKRTYQMNPANGDEALYEALLDISEGADIIMVKPGMPYLDVLYRVKEQFKKPTAVYHISGEYAALKAAALNGWLNFDSAILESMLCFKRAGADIIWTYAALEIANLLKKD